MTPAYFMGLDLGQAQDYTALAVLRRSDDVYDSVRLDRQRGRSYVGTPAAPGLVETVHRFLLANPVLRGAQLALDRTGVGRAVADAFRAAGLPCVLWAVTVTAGQNVRTEGLDLFVPKKDLVAAVQTLLEAGRLRLSALDPLTPVLVRELKDFRVRITAAGNETFAAWRENAHDDLVFAVALACWLGERFPAWGEAARLRSGGAAYRERDRYTRPGQWKW